MKTTKKFLLKMIILFLLSILTACAGNADLSSKENVSSIATDETRIEGALLRINGDEMVIQQSDGKEVLLHTSESTIFWEGIDWLADMPAEIGDKITALGKWSKDQTTFEVESYYANLQELKGSSIMCVVRPKPLWWINPIRII